MNITRLASTCIAMVLLAIALCLSPNFATAQGATTQPGHHCHKHKHKHEHKSGETNPNAQ